MKVTIDNEDYELDIEKAKELGLLKKKIILKSGQVYSNGSVKVLLIADDNEDSFILTGRNGNICTCFYDSPKDIDIIFNLIETKQWKYVGELGKDVSLDYFKT